MGAIRHSNPLLCGIGALAMHLFARFHIDKETFNFVPEYTENVGEYGCRTWYSYPAFYGNSITEQMSYSSVFLNCCDCLDTNSIVLDHWNRLKKMHKASDIAISKSTHAGRAWAAFTMRQFGASVADAKAIGQWSSEGSFKSCHDRELPIRGLLGAAMFNAEDPKAHFLARDILGIFL